VDFGLVFITSAEWPADPDRFDRARRLGARWDRWPLYWSGVEISPGVYRWASVDTALRDALAQGFEVSLILLGTPGFYATGGLPLRPPVGGSILRRSEARTPGAPIAIAAASPPAGLYAPIFTDGTDRPGPGKTINPENRWAAFVYQAVARYRPGGAASREVPGWPAGRGVRDWEIWNEPDLSFFWSGSAADYARLLRVAAIAARQADPQARILFGGLAIFEKPDWPARGPHGPPERSRSPATGRLRLVFRHPAGPQLQLRLANVPVSQSSEGDPRGLRPHQRAVGQ
jgi:hypothetical protein